MKAWYDQARGSQHSPRLAASTALSDGIDPPWVPPGRLATRRAPAQSRRPPTGWEAAPGGAHDTVMPARSG
jgi:hypothetical protein